ncbi:Abi family protein [Campylobacter lari]|uniref:Abi family protein n=1 Tax=Campylobacter lari TaxID=201 RepID=UPI00127B4716|nr:Abi family protein [Campylobacter lari]EAK0980353.1 Abi family protein [Campylobacter lari]MBT0825334.1 Abi family protein [Campylobacter lari]
MIKHKLDIDQQIEYMQEQGIKFDLIDKEKAKIFLNESNYFFKIKVFAKNYDRDRNNKYIRLDFAYLREISIIDTLLRDIILELCLTCEHLLKTQINTHCSQDVNQDGYKIVQDFLSSNPEPFALVLYKDKKKCNIYQKRLIEKYYINNNGKWENHFALWNFIEILTFSEFVKFYQFYCNVTKMPSCNFVDQISKLRNASAHNFCILNNLKSYGNFSFKPTKQLQTKLRKLSVIGKNKKLTYLENPLIHDCICLLFLIKELCPPKMLKKIKKKLFSFIKRSRKKKQYFIDNQYIVSSFNFMIKILIRII